MKPWIKRSALAAGAIIAGFALFMPVFGTRTLQPPDQTPGYRVAQITPDHRAGPVEVQIWYPTDASQPPELIAQNALFYGFYAQTDAAPDRHPHPVVVMSHGSGGTAKQLGWLAVELARNGMIVIAPNHPGTMSRDSDPFQTPMIWQREQDLTAALDVLAEQPAGWPEADMSRVASLGFSLGGPAALGLAGARLSKSAFIKFCADSDDAPDCNWMEAAGVDFGAIDGSLYEADWRDPRVIASVVIDPALPAAMTPDSLAAINLPVLLVSLGDQGPIVQSVKVANLGQQLPQVSMTTIPASWHFSFLPVCSTAGWIIIAFAGEDSICSDWGQQRRADVHDQASAVILPFLQAAFDRP